MISRFIYSILGFPRLELYFLIFFLLLFFGEEVILVVGAASRLGYIDFWDAFFMAYLGAMAGDVLWFKIGEIYGERFIKKYGRWLLVTPARFEKIKNLIDKKDGSFLIVSKFLYSMNHVSLLAAGAVGFSFSRFLRYQFFISFGWVGCFLSLGYFFAHNLSKIIKDVRIFTLLFLAATAAFIALELILEKALVKKAKIG